MQIATRYKVLTQRLPNIDVKATNEMNKNNKHNYRYSTSKNYRLTGLGIKNNKKTAKRYQML